MIRLLVVFRSCRDCFTPRCLPFGLRDFGQTVIEPTFHNRVRLSENGSLHRVLTLHFAGTRVGFVRDAIHGAHFTRVVDSIQPNKIAFQVFELLVGNKSGLVFNVCLNIPRFGSRVFIFANDSVINDIDAVCLHGFHAGIQRVVCDRPIVGFVEDALKRIENIVLLVDFQGENTVKESAHIGSYFGVRFVISKFIRKTGKQTEVLQHFFAVKASELIRSKHVIERLKRANCDRAFKVVLFAEDTAAGVSLPLCQCAELVKSACDRGDKTFMTFNVRRNELKNRSNHLVASMIAPKSLYGFRCLPSCLN